MWGHRREVREAVVELTGAGSYAEWLAAAEQLDRLSGAWDWRDEDEHPAYDAALLRSDIVQFERLRLAGDAFGLARHIEESVYRHAADFSLPSLHHVAWTGTKRLVTRYLDALCAAVDWLADVPGVDRALKLAKLRRYAQNYGQSALLLSGGATLGFMHTGVVKALFEHGLLPDVMSGASMGAMVAAGICCRSDEELRALFADPREQVRTFGLQFAGLGAAWRERALLDPSVMLSVIRHNCGDYTFEEAWRRSGRVLNISVSPTRQGQKPRLLCHLTAPDVLVAESALASSAIPGVFPPARLVRRDAQGQRHAYIESERWIDGSMHGDLPKRRMSRLHNVNHFLVSQTNPHVLPFLVDARLRGRGRAALGVTLSLSRRQGAELIGVVEQVVADTPLRPWVSLAHSLLGQDYLGDVDIHPRFHPRMLLRAFSNATPEEFAGYVQQGERATWSSLARVDVETRIARTLKAAIARVEG